MTTTLTKKGLLQRQELKEQILGDLTELSKGTKHRYSAEFSSDLKLARLLYYIGNCDRVASEVLELTAFGRMVDAMLSMQRRERGD